MTADSSIGDIPDGLYARIPLVDMTLAEAADMVEDPSFWYRTRLPILDRFPQIRLDEYWSLSVGDHRDIYDWLVEQGVLDGQ